MIFDGRLLLRVNCRSGWQLTISPTAFLLFRIRSKMSRRNGIKELLILFCALLIRTSSTTYKQSDFSKIIYLSFGTNSTAPLPPTTDRKLLNVTYSDDTPFSLVTLPWAFNFFGSNIYNIFVNPNGAVHQSKVPSLLQGGPTVNALNASYYGIIAGYFADLNPSAAKKTATITSYTTKNMVSIIYHAVPLFNQSKGIVLSFRISLFNDSRIVIDYDNIKPSPYWISGIRAPLYNNFSVVSEEQSKIGRLQWKTAVVGVYPAIAKVKTGSQFITCPISRVWGARLNSATFVPGSNPSLVLSPFLSSCHDYLDIAISLKSSGITQPLTSCAFQLGSRTTTLICDLSKLPAMLSAALGTIFWRIKGSSDAYAPMAVDAIPLNFSNPTSSAIDRYSMSASLSSGCTNKNLYDRNFSCLNLPCNKSVPILYKNPICFNKIAANNMDRCSSNLAFDAVRSQCCTIAEMDCAGICYGKTEVGTITANGTLGCCVDKLVDCSGVCGGTAQRDACGVCKGKNKKGTGCKTNVVLNTTTGSEQLFFKIDYSNPRKLWSIQHVNITNRNTEPVYVNISNSLNKPELGPTVLLSQTSFTIAPKQELSIEVNISASALYNAHESNWEVKTLQFYYWINPKNSNNDKYYFKLLILPGANNCDAIANVGSCMRVPACILCTTFPTLRVLQLVNNEEESEIDAIGEEDDYGLEQWKGEGGPDEWKYYHRRQLFTGLVPMALGAQVDPPLSGVCINGFSSSLCSLAKFSAAPESSTYTRTLLAVTAFVSVVLALR